MLDEVNSPANGTIQFDLAHQFSMVEINVPVRRYKTTEAQGNFEYTAPVSLTWDTPLTIDGKAVTPYSTGKGSFRFIVPSATGLSLTLDGHLVYDEGVPVNFGSSTGNPLRAIAIKISFAISSISRIFSPSVACIIIQSSSTAIFLYILYTFSK